MSPKTARLVVLGATGAMFALVLADKTSTETRLKRLWPLGVISLGLSFMADVLPEIAGPAAILVLLALAARQKGALGGILGPAAKVSQPTEGK